MHSYHALTLKKYGEKWKIKKVLALVVYTPVGYNLSFTSFV
jgi:hypothetical protein